MNKRNSLGVMVRFRLISVVNLFFAAIVGAGFTPASLASAALQTQGSGQPTVARRIGAIKAINGTAITLAPDSGPDIAVTVEPNARILRIAPGEKDLKNATPVQPQDLQVGDRVRVRGQASADNTSIAALEIIVIPHSELEAKHERERQDWQKRGLGGLVSAVNPTAGTVTISVNGIGGNKDIAKPSTLQEIRPGDQLRARGDRSPDGSELAAEEIVTGSFRNVAGLVTTADATAGTLTVQDLLSRKPVQLRITSDSQLHKLPPEMAQRIAMRFKGGAANGASATPGATPSGSATGAGNSASSGAPGSGTRPAGGAMSAGNSSGGAMAGGGMGGAGMRPGGASDFQSMLGRTPSVTLADLHKGDAVLVVATQGTASTPPTAITLVSGVEPILQASPNGSQAMMLAPWNLGGAPGGDAGSQ